MLLGTVAIMPEEYGHVFSTVLQLGTRFKRLVTKVKEIDLEDRLVTEEPSDITNKKDAIICSRDVAVDLHERNWCVQCASGSVKSTRLNVLKQTILFGQQEINITVCSSS